MILTEEEGMQQSFFMGRIHAEVQPLTLLYTIFEQKRYPFHIQSVDLYIHFNYCKFTVFKVWINHKIRTFSQRFLSHKMHLLALLGLFKDTNDRFYQTFIYSS